MQPSELFNLDNSDFQQLAQAIPVLEAQEAMSALKVQDWPNMKKEGRAKLFRDLNKAANPIMMNEEKKPLSTADLAALLNGR